jgi:hypothetical protein
VQDGYVLLSHIDSVKSSGGEGSRAAALRYRREHIREAGQTCGGMLQLELCERRRGDGDSTADADIALPFDRFVAMLASLHSADTN